MKSLGRYRSDNPAFYLPSVCWGPMGGMVGGGLGALVTLPLGGGGVIPGLAAGTTVGACWAGSRILKMMDGRSLTPVRRRLVALAAKP